MARHRPGMNSWVKAQQGKRRLHDLPISIDAHYISYGARAQQGFDRVLRLPASPTSHTPLPIRTNKKNIHTQTKTKQPQLPQAHQKKRKKSQKYSFETIYWLVYGYIVTDRQISPSLTSHLSKGMRRHISRSTT